MKQDQNPENRKRKKCESQNQRQQNEDKLLIGC